MIKSTLEENGSQFIAVYGRRRVGKTYLIEECFNRSFAFHHSGVAPDYRKKLEQQFEAQMSSFINSLKSSGVEDPNELPTSWFDAFLLLEKYIESSKENDKKIIFIDELAWMDVEGYDFYEAFSKFWNVWCFNRIDIILVVAASATTWMLDNVINNTGSLYNRVNHYSFRSIYFKRM